VRWITQLLFSSANTATVTRNLSYSGLLKVIKINEMINFRSLLKRNAK